MEKRLGVIAILINKRDNVHILNSVISEFNDIIMGRMGLPMKDKHIQIISLIVEGNTDQIGALTGKIGRLDGISVRSILTRYKEEEIKASL